VALLVLQRRHLTGVGTGAGAWLAPEPFGTALFGRGWRGLLLGDGGRNVGFVGVAHDASPGDRLSNGIGRFNRRPHGPRRRSYNRQHGDALATVVACRQICSGPADLVSDRSAVLARLTAPRPSLLHPSSRLAGRVWRALPSRTCLFCPHLETP